MKKAGIGAVAVLAMLTLASCNKQADVLTALGVVDNVIVLGQDDLPALVVAGILTPADQTAANNWLTVAHTLNGQAKTCVSNLGTNAKTAAIAACVNVFGQGLLSPAEQAQLRIISPKAQKKVTLYVTAVVLAANFAAQLVSATQVATPPVGTTPSANVEPTHEDLHELATRLNLSPAYGF